MKHFLFLTTFLFISTVAETHKSFAFQQSKIETARELLAKAEEVYFQQDVEQAKELLIKALNSNPSEEEQATAERQLATLEWRIYQNYPAAAEHLARAENLKAQKAEMLIEKARMETALEKYDAAYLTAKGAISETVDKQTHEQAILALATVVRSAIVNTRLNNAGISGRAISAEEKRRLLEAYNLLLSVVKEESGQLEMSRVLFTLALFLDEKVNALMAWRSYFHFQEGGAGDSILANAYKNLKNALANGNRKTKTREASEKLAMALADARFFDDAAIIIFQSKTRYGGKSDNSARLNDIAEYALFCRRLQNLTEGYYRQIVIKKGNPDEFKKQLLEEGERLWKKLSWAKDIPAFSGNIFQDEARKRFGAEINIGETGGTIDLHMGHHVIDEARTITQYNHTAEIKFISLDSMVSNGFQSWLWDGRAAHGGWATATVITQVRPAYSRGSIRAWRALTDLVEKKKADEEIEKDSLADEARAQQNPYAFLSGLQKRLTREGNEQLITILREKNLTGDALKLAFLAEYERINLEYSIFLHEGRHSIDAKLKLNLTNDELEFRAKLSQVVFSSAPRMSLSSIFDANIGDDTPHGIANLKVMKGVVAWMEANKSSIKGLDSSKPFLPQFDLLTDEQIKAAFRSMEPFLKG